MVSNPWDSDEDDLEDYEDPDLADQDPEDLDPEDEEEGAHVTLCYYCGQPIYEDADVCPHCGSFQLPQDAPHHRPPLWWLIIVILCVLGVLLWLF